MESGVKVRQSERTRSSAAEFDQAHGQSCRPWGNTSLLQSADKPEEDGELLVQQDFISLFTIVAILHKFKTMG